MITNCIKSEQEVGFKRCLVQCTIMRIISTSAIKCASMIILILWLAVSMSMCVGGCLCLRVYAPDTCICLHNNRQFCASTTWGLKKCDHEMPIQIKMKRRSKCAYYPHGERENTYKDIWYKFVRIGPVQARITLGAVIRSYIQQWENRSNACNTFM